MVGLDAPTEIADFDDVALLDQDVLGLDVSVNQALLVQVIDSRANLNEEVERCVLAQVLLLTYQVEQISFGGVLECKVDRRFVLEGGVEPANVLVVQLLLDPDLSNQGLFDLAARE